MEDTEHTDLFAKDKTVENKDLPLAVRMRPRRLEEVVGQRHILGKGKLLRRAIESDKITSLILYGPPGVGKTSLAYCISNITKAYFVCLNATTSNVEELRKTIQAARNRRFGAGRKTIVFIDEIHRFNKAQQDVLMPDVEECNIVLIGATVHNPFFSIASPLLSRSLVFELKPLTQQEILSILFMALKDKTRGLGNIKIKAQGKALEFLAHLSDGDARRALNALEIGILTTQASRDGFIHFDLGVAAESIQKKIVLYDRDEDSHYDSASAFIKSMRGCDPDATLYWMAKMLYAGEDPRFIARRICIAAAEDVGNADPLALVVANAALGIAEFVGLPEARIPLAQAAVYVACAPKSNAAYLGIEKAYEDIEKERLQEVPLHLKDASYPGAKKLGRGEGYKYPHNYKQHYLKQEYMPKKTKYYKPSDIGYEAKIKKRLENLKNISNDRRNEELKN
jgi:putative ATPase